MTYSSSTCGTSIVWKSTATRIITEMHAVHQVTWQCFWIGCIHCSLLCAVIVRYSYSNRGEVAVIRQRITALGLGSGDTWIPDSTVSGLLYALWKYSTVLPTFAAQHTQYINHPQRLHALKNHARWTKIFFKYLKDENVWKCQIVNTEKVQCFQQFLPTSGSLWWSSSFLCTVQLIHNRQQLSLVETL